MLRPSALAALLLPLCAFATTESVPLEVSLTVKERCQIDRDERATAPPAVNCALGSPYRVQPDETQRPAVRHAQVPARNRADAPWEIVF